MKPRICVGAVALALILTACTDQKPAPVDTTLVATDVPSAEQVPVLAPVATTSAAQTSMGEQFMLGEDPLFASYAATPWRGELVEPTPGPDDQAYITRLREAAGDGINFAGNSTLMRFGCGTGCSSGYVINRETGEVHSLGLGGEDQLYLSLAYYSDSRLLKAGWEAGAECVYQSYVWSGSELRPLGEPLLERRGEECAMGPQ